jgi:hypothetical protein
MPITSAESAVADGDEGTADAGAEQIPGAQDDRDGERHDQEVDFGVAVEGPARERRRRDVEAADAPGHAFPFAEHEAEEELGRERGDGQIEPLDPQARKAHGQADAGRQAGSRRERQPERRPEIG